MSTTEVIVIIFSLLILGEACFIGFALLTDRSPLDAYPPDDPGEPLLRFRRLSSRDGAIWYSGLFTAAVYPDGLYVSTEPLFGLFKSNRGIFVPWEDLFVSRKWSIFGQEAQLQLGSGMNLIVPEYVANKLAHVAKHRWPEDGTFPVVTLWTIAPDFLRFWAIITTIAGIFFSILLYLASSDTASIWFGFAVPCLFFGIILLVRFARDAHAIRG